MSDDWSVYLIAFLIIFGIAGECAKAVRCSEYDDTPTQQVPYRCAK